jgi:Tfp pilus assembly PilM family ATPase
VCYSDLEVALRQMVQALTESLGLEEDVVLLLLAEVGLAPQTPEHATHAEAIAPIIWKYLDALSSSLQSPLAYAGAQYPGAAVGGVLLVGHGAGIPGVADYLQQRLGISVRVVAPADVVQGPSSLSAKAADSSLVAAIGLARFSDG